MNWIPTAERLPPSGRKVIAFFRNDNGKPRQIMAFYAAKHDIESDDGDLEGAYEYSESRDNY